MTKPINIFSLSRIHEEEPFNIVKKLHSQTTDNHRIKYHEIESLRLLTNELIRNDVSVEELDGFFYSFTIPQIGKEFDLLKITDKDCLNIELKSDIVSEEKILDQLLRNCYYLRHLGKRLLLYSVITSNMTCYKLLQNNELAQVDFEEIVNTVHKMCVGGINAIDDMFRTSDYLVSPLNTPTRFIQGEYFLTLAQEQIKRSIIYDGDSSLSCAFFHVTGKPGTGKTLLLYDIAKTLSKKGETLIIHCGKLSHGQQEISWALDNLKIIPARLLEKEESHLQEYHYILVDETQRMYGSQFEIICNSARKNNQICVFSSDPEQVLSKREERTDIVNKIKTMRLKGAYVLSEKIRTNKELQSFIMCVLNLNHKAKTHMDYSDVELNYANTTREAQKLIEYYRSKEYIFINYSKSNYRESPYSVYEEDSDTHHVIGQEFDKVVMLLDASFFYDKNGILQGTQHPNPDYLYPKLFYQGITRVREKLALIIVGAPELFAKVVSIVNQEK